MKVLVVGNGGREHAIAWKISQSPLLTELYCAPGNPGTASIATNVDISVSEIDKLATWAKDNQIALTVVGPEAPLADGIADVFSEHGLKVFGPSKAAAELEASKSFAKEVMNSAGVRTPEGDVFTDYDQAIAYIKERGAPIVVKADGLAAGKGVTVAASLEEATEAVKEAMLDKRFGDAGSRVVIEECIIGQESSVMAVVDGETLLPLVVSRDYKRLEDEDRGPNTGGMGAITPSDVISDERGAQLVEELFRPVIDELKSRGIHFRGFLYGGLIVDAEGVERVLEFNCRLGDPETQIIMMRLESDLLEVLSAAVNGNLADVELKAKKNAAACIVASSRGYPRTVDDGKSIDSLPDEQGDRVVFQAGTKLAENQLVTKGGRVLAVTATGDTLKEALVKAYAGISEISFEGMHYRKDIGGGV